MCYRLLLLDRLAVACVLTGIVQIIPMAGAIAAESIRNPWGSCSTCSSTMHTAATLRGSCDLDGVGCCGQGTYGRMGVGLSFCAGEAFQNSAAMMVGVVAADAMDTTSTRYRDTSAATAVFSCKKYAKSVCKNQHFFMW